MTHLLDHRKHFNYSLTGTGWAEVTFANDNQSITFEVSYLSDPLAELLEALFRLLQKESTSEKIVFADEPGEHTLLLTMINYAELEIQIFWSDDWEETAVTPRPSAPKTLKYHDKDTLISFAGIVCLGIENLLRKTTLEDYKKNWRRFEFPLDSYNKVKALIRDAVQ